MAHWPIACAKWLLPVPPGPRNNASSRLLMNALVARSNTRLRFIFGLKVKSKLSRVRSASRKAACFEHRAHAAQAELAQRAVEFDEVHDGISCFEFWVRLSMRSR